jgi:hypothetical protein
VCVVVVVGGLLIYLNGKPHLRISYGLSFLTKQKEDCKGILSFKIILAKDDKVGGLMLSTSQM